ncbi:hypothetical protein KAFR_0F01670 [Kazachstania africana CBS 2517]|uniref:Alpha-1,6-mannosyltransferase MNN11 n=1 Tax=Kazachstania africana (strain ATCC 22294 / BCRC 22015 / CBS 2517 / CECT 1963 / NBRC 1671 / NRRL Y-8276) TaxID=1071382 RepID=H2AWL4_KAZAF|nr:hypothetical protein KAFR_0F01670 [Kazachstania africana CBS 2517]CCF58764.1 hypothetical protein KAFR_0F01670 [Kazachstania africana CBS 2517]
MVLKPKSKNKSQQQTLASSKWPLGLPPMFKSSRSNRNYLNMAVVFTAFVLFFYVFSRLFYPSQNSALNSKYTKEHGHYLNELPASSHLIFPHVEHAPLLKEVGISGLFVLRLEGDGSKKYVLKPDDKPFSDDEKKQTTDQVLLVKRSFLDHGKLVFRPKKNVLYPETIIVTLIDFDIYSLDTIVKVVQNRVDYAQSHNYGLYVRWIQEFFPLLEDQNLSASYEYIKPLIMRAAMHAFPKSKNFVFIDQDALVMNLGLSLEKHLLDPNILDVAISRDIPVMAGSNVRTYKNFRLSNTEIIIPQDENGILDLSAFVVTNSVYGRVFLEYLSDPLISGYAWQSTSYAVGHVLQWHPLLLSRTAIVAPKLLASKYDPQQLTDGNDENTKDGFHYNEGDLVASFKNCRERNSCAQDIEKMYEKVIKK